MEDKMAAIDNLLASHIVSEISEKLSGLSAGKKVSVPFGSLELGAQATATTEDEIIDIINLLNIAKGWESKVDFIGRVVVFYS